MIAQAVTRLGFFFARLGDPPGARVLGLVWGSLLGLGFGFEAWFGFGFGFGIGSLFLNQRQAQVFAWLRNKLRCGNSETRATAATGDRLSEIPAFCDNCHLTLFSLILSRFCRAFFSGFPFSVFVVCVPFCAPASNWMSLMQLVHTK